jgi:hypothetical protein
LFTWEKALGVILSPFLHPSALPIFYALLKVLLLFLPLVLVAK